MSFRPVETCPTPVVSLWHYTLLPLIRPSLTLSAQWHDTAVTDSSLSYSVRSVTWHCRHWFVPLLLCPLSDMTLPSLIPPSLTLSAQWHDTAVSDSSLTLSTQWHDTAVTDSSLTLSAQWHDTAVTDFSLTLSAQWHDTAVTDSSLTLSAQWHDTAVTDSSLTLSAQCTEHTYPSHRHRQCGDAYLPIVFKIKKRVTKKS